MVAPSLAAGQAWAASAIAIATGGRLLNARAATLLNVSKRAEDDPICMRLKACQREAVAEGNRKADQRSAEKVRDRGAILPRPLIELARHIDQVGRLGHQSKAARVSSILACLTPEQADAELPDLLNLSELRRLCAEGIPDELPALRAAVWKTLLGYLPVNVWRWEDTLRKTRKDHAVLLKQLLASLSSKKAADQEVHKLSHLITKDVARTRPEMTFFSENLRPSQATVGGGNIAAKVAAPCQRSDILTRILLMYARLNPGIGYVQGMNEICAPLYFLFAMDPLCDDASAEADAFFCFSLIMAEMRDAFIEDLNHTEGGMIGRMQHVDEVLKQCDVKVWEHLHRLDVSPMSYTARWMTSLLAQDLDTPEVLRTWDALLGNLLGPHPLLDFLCAARVIAIRKLLLAGDEWECFELLKRGGYPALPVQETLTLAFTLRTEYTVAPAIDTRARLPALRRDPSAHSLWEGAMSPRSISKKEALTFSARSNCSSPIISPPTQRGRTVATPLRSPREPSLRRFMKAAADSGRAANATRRNIFSAITSPIAAVAKPRRQQESCAAA